MKILSVIVPCYNSQDYIKRCVDSLLTCGEKVDKVEIIIVNDGSNDETAAIADEYQRRFPKVVKVIHQENKGHGGAINTGIDNAGGVYLKVVDSDDWVDAAAYGRIIDTLSAFAADARPDMVISNYVYEKAGKRQKIAIKYTRSLPEGRLFRWDETKPFRIWQYLLMHSIIYRLEILKECGLRLPEHKFYVDNIYAYVPMKLVETMYYLNVNLYRYFIGRDTQSINEKTMMRRIEQQLAVNKIMVEAVDLRGIRPVEKRAYLVHHLGIVTAVSSILLMRDGSARSMMKKAALWRFIKHRDALLHDKLRFGLTGFLLHLPSRMGRGVSVIVYKIARLIVGFS